MNIIHVATEFAPIIKVGGLADVVYSLCTYLSQKKKLKFLFYFHYIRVLQLIKSLKIFANIRVFPYKLPLALIALLFGKRVSKKIILYFLEISFYFQEIYCDVEIKQFLFLSLAAIQFIHLQMLFHKNIFVHIHDWPTSFIAPLLKYSNRHTISTVLTLHNLEYQGVCSIKDLLNIGWNKTFFIPKYILQKENQIIPL